MLHSTCVTGLTGQKDCSGTWWFSAHAMSWNITSLSLPANILACLFFSFLSPSTRPEEMKDHVESSEEPNSIPTDSNQSKGKCTEKPLTRGTYLTPTPISLEILISSLSCWFENSPQPEAHQQCAADCYPVLPPFRPPPLSFLHISVRAGHRHHLHVFLQGQMHFVKILCFSMQCCRYDPDMFGLNVSACLWRWSVMNHLQTLLSNI